MGSRWNRETYRVKHEGETEGSTEPEGRALQNGPRPGHGEKSAQRAIGKQVREEMQQSSNIRFQQLVANK
ncbi:MAG TPA: hypothetical protein DEP53_14455 [Bacteroidetes bacterium]|nr:hypothetical protein [Bacteroidota bacterium]